MKICIKLIGDSDHFTFEHRMFNFIEEHRTETEHKHSKRIKTG